MGLGELDKAEPIFRQLLEMVPDDIEAKTGLVKIDYAHNNLEEAKHYTEEILALKPDNEEVKSLQTEILNAIVFQKKLEHTTRASSVIRSPSINDLKSINLHFGKKIMTKLRKMPDQTIYPTL
ncbi:Tetratricopeptide repeat-containing protein [Bartonella apihabitans]|nr:Tetratricopeptide repeat-containing protein [Bartonella apihabitans]